MAARQKKCADNIAMRNERKDDKWNGVGNAKAKARQQTIGKGRGKPCKGKQILVFFTKYVY